MLRSRMVAVSSLCSRSTQLQMLVSGDINALPTGVREYSTATDFDVVTRLATNPADSKLRSVLVRIRCETPSRHLISSPWRCGLFCRQVKILTVHLPMKTVAITFEPRPDFLCICSTRQREIRSARICRLRH